METAPATRQPSDATVKLDETSGDTQQGVKRRRWFHVLRGVPAWLISLVLHVVILVALALITIADRIEIANVLSARVDDESASEFEDLQILPIDAGAAAASQQPSQTVDVSATLEVTQPTPVAPTETSIDIELLELSAGPSPAASSLQSLSTLSPQQLGSRSGDSKLQLLQEYGGNSASEAAVAEALQWLSRHQLPNGSWSFRHELACKGACGDPGAPNRARAVNAATALALLPFLGAGQTHVQGRYRQVVSRGLKFLVNNGRRGKKAGMQVLDLSESFFGIQPGNLYSHGFAAITLCEAYAMTKDPELRQPAQNALNFIVYAQCEDGGWKYYPRDPDGGDTSVTGWQVMALKSGLMGNLDVPKTSFVGTMRFLDKVQSNDGAMYGYMYRQTDIIPSCTAVGLLCRMYLGWEKTRPGLVAGIDQLSEVGVLKDDLYYDYYAAQVLRHYGGPDWKRFNLEMRDWLVETQATKRGAKGSWFFPDSESLAEGGRLANTAFATMMLEVYYRHMPLYAEAAANDDFPL